MKRIFRKIAKFFGFVAKQPTSNYNKEWNEGFNENKTIHIFEARTKEWDSEMIVEKKRLPKDANDIQKLDKKYNNPNSVYRDKNGRFASF